MRTIKAGVSAAIGCILLNLICQSSWATDVDASPARQPPPEDQTQDSVTYQINPGHTGSITFTTSFKTPLKLLWTKILGAPVSYPIIAQGLVFVTVGDPTHGGQLIALKLTTGALVWQQPILGTYNVSNATYDKNNLFVVNHDGLVREFSAAAGAPGWTQQLSQYSFSAPPTAVNGQIFEGGAGSGGTLYAIDETSGAVQWSQSVNSGDASSPTVNGSALYVSYTCVTYKFATADGTQLWYYFDSCSGGGGQTSVDYDGRLYAPSTANGNLIFDDTNGNVVGSFGSGWPPTFFQDLNGNKRGILLIEPNLSCFDPTTGNTVWSFTGDGQIVTLPIVVNGLVIAFSNSGMLYALNGVTGAVAWSTNTGHPIPAGASTGPVTGLGAGQGTLLIPAGTQLTAYGPRRTSFR